MTIENLLGGIPPTLLPADPALDELVEHGGERFVDIASRHLTSSLCWAILAEGARNAGTPDGSLIAYAFARTGYHRGLDALRRNGWKGSGPVPWEHEPNRGFLRCLALLAALSDELGDDAERDRCWQFVRDCSESGYHVLRDRAARPAAPLADIVADVTASSAAVDADEEGVTNAGAGDGTTGDGPAPVDEGADPSREADPLVTGDPA